MTERTDEADEDAQAEQPRPLQVRRGAMLVEEVADALKGWQQGDVLMGVDIPFVCFAHADLPLSDASRAAKAGEDALLDVLTDEIGYAILSQTCDIVKSAEKRPYIELCPVVEVSVETMAEVAALRTPRFALLPALASRRLVADLDRVMVVEKPVAAALPADAHARGCTSDAQIRRFAEAVARKHLRFAFPDDFNAGMRRVAACINQKHSKQSALGGFLKAVHDIRAVCPNWSAAKPDVLILFVFETTALIPADADKHIDDLLSRFTPTGAFARPRGQVAAYDTMTAARYRASDQLDFERLSIADND